MSVGHHQVQRGGVRLIPAFIPVVERIDIDAQDLVELAL
jgi:hypothetical protein